MKKKKSEEKILKFKKRLNKAVDHSFKSTLFTLVLFLVIALLYYIFGFFSSDYQNFVSSLILPSFLLFLFFYLIFFFVSIYITLKAEDGKILMILFIPLTPLLVYKKLKEDVKKIK